MFYVSSPRLRRGTRWRGVIRLLAHDVRVIACLRPGGGSDGNVYHDALRGLNEFWGACGARGSSWWQRQQHKHRINETKLTTNKQHIQISTRNKCENQRRLMVASAETEPATASDIGSLRPNRRLGPPT